MLDIFTNDELTKYLDKYDIKIENVIKEVLDTDNINYRDKKINIYIESKNKQEIKDINKKYRNIDKETDVLSFGLFKKEDLNKTLDSNIKEIELGNIFLCLEVIENNSKEYDTGIKREIIYMIVHGILHLLDYDHIELLDKKEMRQKEKEILKKIGVFK